MQHGPVAFIFPCPENPAVNAYNSVVEINWGFADEVRLKTDNDIKNGIYKPNRIYEDVFIPVEPNAYDTEYNGNKFVPPGFL